MKWSYKRPTEGGFYFLRMGYVPYVYVVRVVFFGKVCMVFHGNDQKPLIKWPIDSTEWAGPIAEPTEPTEPKKTCPHKDGFVQGRFDKRFECPDCGMLEPIEATTSSPPPYRQESCNHSFCQKADDGHWFCPSCGEPELEDGDLVFNHREDDDDSL